MNTRFPRPIHAPKDKLITTALLLAVVAAMKLFAIPCPFYALTTLPCPTCGMTRAWTAVLSLDFQTALAYHPLFWAVPLLYLCFLYDGRLFKKTWMNVTLYTVIGLLFALHWIVTLFS